MGTRITRNDRRAALIVEGGGVRGAYAVGALRILHEYGGESQFERIYAVSSGVFAATYFAAGQVEEMESTWRDLVHGSLLINYLNPLRGKPVLNLDYLIELFKGSVKLDLDRLSNSSAEIRFVATDSSTGEPLYFDAKRPEIFDLMRASSALPFVYPHKIHVDGLRLEDGGHSDPLPIARAIEEGYNDIVIIRTRPEGFQRRPSAKLLSTICIHKSRNVRDAFKKSYKVYNEALGLIENKLDPDIRLIVVSPQHMKITGFTRSRGKIIEAIEQGKRDAERVFLQSLDQRD